MNYLNLIKKQNKFSIKDDSWPKFVCLLFPSNISEIYDKHVTCLLEPILISEHALNVSCGPQPRHVSPLEFSPQLFAVL